MKEIHFWQFPERKIYVKLEEGFQKDFFDALINRLGSRWELMKRLGVGYTTTKHWQYGWRFRTPDRREDQYCPVWALKKICHIYSDVMGLDLNCVLHDIERHIHSYRAHSGTKILKPRLPIKNSCRLYSIIAHMIADGTWSEGCCSKYINSSDALRREFVDDLKRVFGDVEIYESFARNHVPHIIFPSAVMYIISSHLPFKFSGINGLPKSVISLPPKTKARMLRSFFDDEGYVHDSNIQICSLDIEMLNMIKLMLKSLEIESSNLKKYKDYERVDGSISKVAYFNIFSRSIPKFSRKIGFSHPKKKKRLDLIMKIRLRPRHPNSDKIRSTILAQLKERGVLTAADLSLACVITSKNLRKNYLYPAENEGIIERMGKGRGKGGPVLWRLKE
ncbi:MAG: hypothetical protein JXC85_00460 [Candidatus Aenigmarchaeota archaeon]|nr:hypothetical protein [Candidatus Aenigmarchaeota archaeon]